MKARWKKRQVLQDLLTLETRCFIQYTGWPCNTCFHAMELANISPQRLHEMWESTLLLRGDYKNGQYGICKTDSQFEKDINELIDVLARAHNINLKDLYVKIGVS